jgi:hypothetical protein
VRVSEDFDYINRASLVGRFRVYSRVYVYHSVRRYQAEGVGSLVQKQFKSGFIYLFTGKAHDTEDYEFGTFSRYALPESNGRRAEKDPTEVRRLLSSFDKQSTRLRTQIERMEDGSAPPRPVTAGKRTPVNRPRGEGKRKPPRKLT